MFKFLIVSALCLCAYSSTNLEKAKAILASSNTSVGVRYDLERLTTKGHTRNSYKTARKHLFGTLHLERDNGNAAYIRDVYCDEVYTNSTPRIGKIGKGRIPNHEVVNCEHTWPQSKFDRGALSRYQVGDLHHLYPSQNRANSTRGNYNFGKVDAKNSRLDYCPASKFDGNTYEPPTYHKGNVARAMFYFAVRYDRKINSQMEETLRQWHELDPVDEEERLRNDRIEDIQGNRNPFIDAPDLVSRITDF